MTSQNKDYRLKVSITHDKRTTGNILCEVYLPKKITDPVELIFHPTSEQSNQLGWPFEFSVCGKIKDFSGQLETTIEANKVYFEQGSTKHWGHELSESLLIGEPVDLTITNFLKHDKHKKENPPIKGIFWLTPNIMLSPVKSLSHSFTGETTVRNIRNFEFVLDNGCCLKFDHYYRYLENDDGDTVSFAELVAEFEIDHKNEEILSFESIDDFLMLTSFSARQRCVCLGWEIYEPSKITKFYRRDITIPEIKKNHSFRDTLIDICDFEEFIKTAYKNFIKTNKKNLLRQAIHRAIGRENSTLESKYLTLYSALETIVLFYRQNHGLEFIISLAEWDVFKKDVKRFINKHPQFSENKGKRKLIYEKLPELNRVSFATAFTHFCENYNIDLQDLWPVVDRRDGISLSDIRNKLIHGDTFRRRQERALMSAVEHLRWIVERSILSVLGWPYSKSKVSNSFLSKNMTMYREWPRDRSILSKSD